METITLFEKKKREPPPPGYVKVIGSSHLYCKKGTIDELKYWRVIPRGIGDVGKEKQFYLSPRQAPGYEKWSKEPYWQEKIREFEERRASFLFY